MRTTIGKRKSIGNKDLATKTMAREILKDIERKVMLGQHDMVKQQVPTLRTFSREYIDYQKNLKQNRSWQKDESHLRRLIHYGETASYQISLLKK